MSDKKGTMAKKEPWYAPRFGLEQVMTGRVERVGGDGRLAVA